MSRDIAPFGLRMPAELKAEIEAWAQKHARSINSEIVGRLVDSLGVSARPLRSYSDGDLIRELMERYGRGQISIRIDAGEDLMAEGGGAGTSPSPPPIGEV